MCKEEEDTSLPVCRRYGMRSVACETRVLVAKIRLVDEESKALSKRYYKEWYHKSLWLQRLVERDSTSSSNK